MTATSPKPLRQGFELYSNTESIDLPLLWVTKELSATLDVTVFEFPTSEMGVVVLPSSPTCAIYTEKEPFPCLLLHLCSE